MERKRLKAIIKESQVGLLRLQFTDITGLIRCVDVPAGRPEDSFEAGICFDSTRSLNCRT